VRTYFCELDLEERTMRTNAARQAQHVVLGVVTALLSITLNPCVASER